MATAETNQFSDPGFSDRVQALHDEEAEREDELAAQQRAGESLHRESKGDLEDLMAIASEVAKAAQDADVETTPIYELKEKGAVKKAMRNRGSRELVEATEGWVIVPTSAGVVKKSPGKANLANSSGLGLVLTTDGKLYASVSRKPLKSVKDRFTKVKRTEIERGTLLPKEKAGPLSMPEETLLPRYRPHDDEGVPVLIGDLNNPEGGVDSPYFSPTVIEQCYEKLARFAQAHNLQPPDEDEEPTEVMPGGPTHAAGEQATAATAVLQPAPEAAGGDGGDEEPPTLMQVETLSDEEKMDRWFEEGLVTLHTWLGKTKLADWQWESHGGNQFMTVYNDIVRSMGVREDIQGITPETLGKAFEREGIDELLTFSRTGKQFGVINEDSPNAGEEIIKLTYEIPAGSFGRNPKAVVPGNTIIMNILLPESEARDALDMIYKDPELAGEIAERFMSHYLLIGKSWDEARPDYAKMRARRSGVRRMAFRSSVIAQPDQSAIVEF